MSTRDISYSEITAALDCQAKHDFQYGDQLAGSSLKPKTDAPRLSQGKAWGAAVAAWHSNFRQGTLFAKAEAWAAGLEALVRSLDEAAERQKQHGLFDRDEYEETLARLTNMLEHYATTTEPLPLEGLEDELYAPIPSRGGQRRSSKFKLRTYVDGLIRTDAGVWLVEFKLRVSLTPVDLIALSRQIRWYAWAYREVTGTPVVGVLVDERWNEVPKRARLVKARRKVNGDYPLVPSHATNQITTPELYVAACEERHEDPKLETMEALGTRQWQQRQPVMFRESELEEAGREMVSAALQISMLDSGELYPLRNPKRPNCNGCRFKEVCPNPDDQSLIDVLFDRRPAKRNREEEANDTGLRKAA